MAKQFFYLRFRSLPLRGVFVSRFLFLEDEKQNVLEAMLFRYDIEASTEMLLTGELTGKSFPIYLLQAIK